MNKITWDFTEPLNSTDALGAFERRYSHEIPDALKSLILKYNGGYPDKGVFDKPQKGMVFSNLLSFNEDSMGGVHLYLPSFESEGGITALPFATDGFGNLICEVDGKIFFWWHETEELDLVAESIDELLDMLHS